MKVTHLDLSNNKITSTDVRICYLNLLFVDQFSIINRFQNVFSSLSSLVKLDLSNNQIKNVAGDIGSLQKLAYLSLANNKINNLPAKGMSKLKQLKYLCLNNNPLKSDLAEAIGPSQNNIQCQSAAINAIQYFKDNKGDSKKSGNCF